MSDAERRLNLKSQLDRRWASIARNHFGVVSRDQLTALGMHPRAIDRRLKSRMLLPLLPGIYAVPWVKPLWQQKAFAATMWAGDGSALAAISAARVWRLDVDFVPTITVKMSCHLKSPVSWLVIHRVSRPITRRKVEGLFVTTLEETLLDLAAVVDGDSLEEALESALRRSLIDFARIQRFVDRNCVRGRRGCQALRRLLAQRGDIPATGSRFETRFFALLRRAGIPLPERQFRIRDRDGRPIACVDFAWPDAKVVIEADGWLYHSGRKASNRDGWKRNDLRLLGMTVLQFTTDDLRERPAEVVMRVRKALGGSLFG